MGVQGHAGHARHGEIKRRHREAQLAHEREHEAAQAAVHVQTDVVAAGDCGELDDGVNRAWSHASECVEIMVVSLKGMNDVVTLRVGRGGRVDHHRVGTDGTPHGGEGHAARVWVHEHLHKEEAGRHG